MIISPGLRLGQITFIGALINFLSLNHPLITTIIGDCKEGFCLQLHGQVSGQPKRCRSAMLDPKGRAFWCVSGSLLLFMENLFFKFFIIIFPNSLNWFLIMKPDTVSVTCCKINSTFYDDHNSEKKNILLSNSCFSCFWTEVQFNTIF